MPSYSKQIFNLLEYKSRVTPKLFIIKCPPYVHSSFGNNLMIKSLIKRSFFDVNFLLTKFFNQLYLNYIKIFILNKLSYYKWVNKIYESK